MRSLFLLTAYLHLTVAKPIVNQPSSRKCNGNPALCHRKYSNITFIGAHDSPFVGSPKDYASNQNVGVHAQLKAGIRLLSAQVHKNNAGILSLCHTYCWEYNAGSLQAYLVKIRSWIEVNPYDVVTLILANGGFYPVDMYHTAFERAGLANMTFHPSKNPLALHEWPTLGEMIANSTRLVVFMDYKADLAMVPYILPQYEHYQFQTPYDTTDPTFPQCSMIQPNGVSSENRMIVMNHFLDLSVFGTSLLVPDNSRDAQTNAATGPGSIGAQAALCAELYGRYPNFVMVDRFNTGQVFEAQRAMNFPGM